MDMKRSFTTLFPLLPLIMAALIVLSGVALAEEAEPAWEYGSVTGQLRYYYFTQRDKDKDTSIKHVKESLAIGGFLKYETPWIKNALQFGVAGYASEPFPPQFNRPAKGGTGLLTTRNRGIATIGEAYLKGKMGGLTGTVFRQRIETPLVNGSDSRMIPQTFEAYSLTSKDFEELTLQAAWIERIKLRDTDSFEYMSEVSKNSSMANTRRGMFMAGGDWAPAPFKTRTWYYHIQDYMRSIFLQAGGSHPIAEDLSWHWLAQGLDQRSTGDADGGSFHVDEFGLMGGVTINGFTFDAGGTVVDNTTKVVSRWGAYPFFNNMMAYANNRAGERSLYLSTEYDFKRIGWNGFTSSLKASLSKTPNEGRNASPNHTEYDLNMNYAFDGMLKGLTIQNRWSYQESKEDNDGMQVRLRFQYAFQLL